MFEQTNTPPETPPAPVEDIFAQAEPPAVKGKPMAQAPISEAPSAEFNLADSKPSRPWLIWLIVAVVVVLVLGGVAWYLWGRSSLPSVSEPKAEPAAQVPTAPTTIETTQPVVPPVNPGDADGDGLADTDEQALGTDPKRADSDEDGLFDQEEVVIYQSNPLLFDTDGDGYGDGQEVQNGYNPTGPGRLLQLPPGT